MWRVRQITELKEGTFPPDSLRSPPIIDSPVPMCNRLAKQTVHILPLATRKGVDLPTVNMTVANACTRYWEDKNADVVDTDKLAWSLGWIEKHFGRTTRLVDIGDNDIAKMVAKRRGEPRVNVAKLTAAKRRGKPCADDRPVSKATVNRTVTEPMRQILTRARKVWKVPVQQIDWAVHMLPE